MTRYDVAVVGLGLVGSAALRHFSAAGVSAMGIGPAEPVTWSAYEGPFSSHYDSGRVTRRLDARYEWAVLASRSIDEYATIEERSGLTFHHPAGLLFARRDEAGIAHQKAVISALGLDVTIGSSEDVPGEFQGFSLPAGMTVLYEPDPAGYIDPRIMLQAQLAVATEQGAHIARTFVDTIQRIAGGFRVESHDGASTEAERVLVSAGAYTNGLLPEPLAAAVAPEAVVLARVAPDEAQRLSSMPSLIYLLDDPHFDDVYLVPPTRYPDGHHYLKMGGSYAAAGTLATAHEMRAWMRGTAADEQLRPMESILRSLLPDVTCDSFEMKPCLITDTVHGLPFIDQIDEGLFVAAGGNGHAAKSADAIGALGAQLVRTGEWADTDLDRSAFAAVRGEWHPDEGSRHGN